MFVISRQICLWHNVAFHVDAFCIKKSSFYEYCSFLLFSFEDSSYNFSTCIGLYFNDGSRKTFFFFNFFLCSKSLPMTTVQSNFFLRNHAMHFYLVVVWDPYRCLQCQCQSGLVNKLQFHLDPFPTFCCDTRAVSDKTTVFVFSLLFS